MLQENRWYQWTLRLWPQVRTYNPVAQLRATMAMIPIFFISPLAGVAIVWLALIAPFSAADQNWPAFILLTAVLSLLDWQSFTLYMDVGQGKTVSITSSLSSMVIWAGVLAFGPSILWTAVLASLVMTARTLHFLRIYNENLLWSSLSRLVQEWGVGLFTLLAATAVYQAFGGQFPLADPTSVEGPPIVASTVVLACLPSLIVAPVILAINHLAANPDWRSHSVRILLATALLDLVSIPFSLLIALSYHNGGLGHLLLFLVGIVLVNWLIYKFSHSIGRQRRQNQELIRLERLGEALLQSPPDASQLESILADHLPWLFADDKVQVNLFTDTAVAWPSFHYVYPKTEEAPPEADWEALRQSSPPTMTVPRVIMPGETGIYGDAIMVKIQVQDPDALDLAGKCLGGIWLLRHKLYGQTADSLAALQGLAAQIGAALYHAQAHVDILQKHKLSHELAVAGEIQASFLPKRVPHVPGWDVAATLVPAKQTSGDFYDFVALDHGRIGLLVADVSDKGTGAALYMALTRTLLRTYAVQYPDAPAQALQAANQRIFADTESDQFVTVFYAVLELETGRLTYANAGHNPPYVMGETPLALGKTGIPLGMYEEVTWQQETVQLERGAWLAAYTDGITEAQNGMAEEFGEARLLSVLQNGSQTAPEMMTAVLTAVQAFVGDAPQFDDITLMVLHYIEAKKAENFRPADRGK